MKLLSDEVLEIHPSGAKKDNAGGVRFFEWESWVREMTRFK